MTLSEAVDEPCMTPEMEGQWVPAPKDHFSDYKCCGLANRYFRKHEECGLSGPPNFKTNQEFLGRSEFLPPMLAGCVCECNFTETRVWETNENHILPAWDPHAFCHTLGNRTILMVGDSTMAQTAAVFMTEVHPAGCQTQIRMAYGDTLTHEPMGNLNRGRHWFEIVKVHQPDIVILTGGAHIRWEDGFSKWIDTVIEGVVEARQTFPNMQVVWKTQNPAGQDEVLTHLHPFVAAKRAGYRKFNHNAFWGRDNEVIQKLQAAKIPFVDMRMLYSRTDAHPLELGDYLHTCVPGPLSVFPQLIQKLMVNDEFAVARCVKKEEQVLLSAEVT